MKSNCIFALLLLPLLFACNKPEPEQQKSPINGRLNAVKNGEAWEALAHGQISVFDSSMMTLFFSHLDNKTGLTDVMSFNNVPRGVGAYPLIHRPFPGYDADTLIRSLFTINDYDLALADYIMSADTSNILVISTYNADTKKYEGFMNVEFIVKAKANDPGLPDTIRIKNGVFFGEVTR